MSNTIREFYLIRSADGKYLRAKGYGGNGECWVEDIGAAKVWTRLGTARSQVTFWANEYPEYGVPDIVVMTAKITKVLKEADRVKAAKTKKHLSKKKRELEMVNYRLERAQELKEQAEMEIEALKNKLQS